VEIRTSRPEDLDQIEKLIVSRMDPSDGVDARLLMTDPDAGCEWVAVAVDGDRIVSTATLMDETLTLAGLDLPAGQVEQVATDVAHEGRGLVRQLMGWAHERSAERGHLVQVMIGIPYFYRQFGYTYSIRVVERDGVPVATGRSTPPEEGEVVLGEVAGDDDGVKALVHLVSPDRVVERHPALERYLQPRRPDLEQYLVRIPDVPKLFEHLRPVFTQRLQGQEPADVLLGFFRTHVRFRWDGTEIGPYRWGGTLSPAEEGGAGIAPDLLPPLLFGPHGIDGLRRLHADVYPGPDFDLMNALFPPVTSDLLTFYLP
jgi:predicted N-acetyltransferase YhbS